MSSLMDNTPCQVRAASSGRIGSIEVS